MSGRPQPHVCSHAGVERSGRGRTLPRRSPRTSLRGPQSPAQPHPQESDAHCSPDTQRPGHSLRWSHLPRLHARVWMDGPRQVLLVTSQDRPLCWVPEPQVAEHSVHSAQGDQPSSPSSAGWEAQGLSSFAQGGHGTDWPAKGLRGGSRVLGKAGAWGAPRSTAEALGSTVCAPSHAPHQRRGRGLRISEDGSQERV